MIFNYLKSFLYVLIFMIGLTIILTLFHYFNIINNNIISFIKLLIPIISITIGGLVIGKSSRKKGYLKGMKLSIIFVIILALINFLIFKNSFEIKILLYYLIIIISAMIGSMIGINRKKVQN